ncbi:MAG: SRPBCC domain-containing protein, partial [Candidatus Riflebacteria bacterium]|nr:SRPBCC domain-containing protein [Candidatus Riflebacteria bacterium]
METKTTEGRVISRNLPIRATPQRVFQALTKAEELPAWICDGVTIDPKVGGKMELRWHVGKAEPDVSELTIQELVPDKKLVMKGEKRSFWPNTTLTFQLKQDGDRTILSFTHDGFPADFPVAEYETRWTHKLEALRNYVETGRVVVRPLTGTQSRDRISGEKSAFVAGAMKYAEKVGPNGVKDLINNIAASTACY